VISLYGATQFAKLMGTAFITEDGEAIEGEALEDIVVLGRVTYFVNRAGEDDSLLSEVKGNLTFLPIVE
jgi:DNA polymerase V